MGCGLPGLEAVECVVGQLDLPAAKAQGASAGSPGVARPELLQARQRLFMASRESASGRARAGSGRCRRPGARRPGRPGRSGRRAGRGEACPRSRSASRQRTARSRRSRCRSRPRRRVGGREAHDPDRTPGRCPDLHRAVQASPADVAIGPAARLVPASTALAARCMASAVPMPVSMDPWDLA